MKQDTFHSVQDRVNWAAVRLSEGHVEAVWQFVDGRNKFRDLQNGKGME